MLSLFRPSLPSDLVPIVSAHLDAYVRHAQRKRRGAKERIYWFRRGNAFILAEEFMADGDLTGRHAAKFVYENSAWHLYCIDASRKWQRYNLAPAEQSFAVVLRHFQEDATGIFGARLTTLKRRGISAAAIEREALAALVGS